MASTLDCRGLQCPEPVVRTRAFISTGNRTQINVIVDNQAAVENVGRFLNRNGFEVTVTQPGDNEWNVRGDKTGEAQGEKPIPDPKPSHDKTVVLLTTETLGRGDDELGAKLMTTFLENLPELEDALWRVILLNGAVKLAAREDASLNALKKLQTSGIDILVCGTCLNHYGLLEKKQVGETTNMMDVLTSLSLAQKVIRP